MNSVLPRILIGLAVLISFHGISADEPVAEDAIEFERIDVLFSTDTAGIIEAYQCRSCPAKVFQFDAQLVVHNIEGATLFEQLQNVDGKAGTVTWLQGTTRAARIFMY
ncbi:hypothetical protein [Endozoicomonas sp. SCSIO W0465]|uniref:hypothetical protein n=1 Tax=Endozoicomonas sp. SCSIO W0465 TaxID=2918516 RepID=UPI00207579D4|nr:hypothetical protein [Endozoicomonas sp. SCSIO W0465]USE37538.1 hypothetical protein MJO57_04810 [Endozoicomonas sp. SCSIO W0465]